MQVSYDSSSPADQWRCNTYSIFSRPSQIITNLVIALVLGYGLYKSNPHPALGLAGFEAMAVAGWTAFLLLIPWPADSATSAKPASALHDDTNAGGLYRCYARQERVRAVGPGQGD